MDIPRDPAPGKRRRVVLSVGLAAVLALGIVTIVRLGPAAPTVDRDEVLVGMVERGTFVRQVRGPGVLVPEEMRYVVALTAGRVEEVLVQPGVVVEAGTVILRLANPDVELEALHAEQQLTAARGDLVRLERMLRSERLQQEATAAAARADAAEGLRQAAIDSTLAARGLVSRDAGRRSRELADALATRSRSEEGRLDLQTRTIEREIAVQADQVARLSAIRDLLRRRVESMVVTAGATGVLQDLSLEVGQWVQSGATLARVARPERLEAHLRIPQTQAGEVAPGQPVVIDVRTDSVAGRVRRVDPNVQNGAVLVEVALEEPLPAGLRPDLSVDGAIEVARVDDALHVERPAFARGGAAALVFRLVGDGEAVRTTVRFGHESVRRIEVVEGLDEGDRILLSDLSRYDDAERIEIR